MNYFYLILFLLLSIYSIKSLGLNKKNEYKALSKFYSNIYN